MCGVSRPDFMPACGATNVTVDDRRIDQPVISSSTSECRWLICCTVISGEFETSRRFCQLKGMDMSQHRFVRLLAAAGSFVMLIAVPVFAQTAPDNTKVNTRDRADGSVTADQQKNDKADRDLTQQIRRALTKDKTLSTYAHNVKVVAQDGRVTLKGPVRSEEERKVVAAKAVDVAGAGHVTNELTIAPEQKK
jgi:osmotically-inducible protein OsmY